MNRILSRLKLWQKIIVIICTFTLPLGVLVVFVFQGYQKDINFARWEKWGNEYQRSLEELLDLLPQHHSLLTRYLGNERELKPDVASKAAQIDRAFENLEAVDAKLGSALQFTPEGLAKRKREHVQARQVKGEWQNLKTQSDHLSLQSSQEQHAHLILDVRTMITHAGDNSNLILDPDLDSYYLMDVTLLALPQTQDRLAVIIGYGEELLRKKAPSKSEATLLAVHGALLKEADLDRVVASTQTALNEDPNFYGRSESLQRNLPPLLAEYTAATTAFIELIQRIATAEKIDSDPALFSAVGKRAREASFRLWQVAVNELDVLLQMRIAHYQYSRNRVFTLTLLALFVSSVLAFYIVRCITAPIGKLTWATTAAAQHGDLTQRVEVKTKDEMGVLSGAFNKMIEGLHGIIVQVQQSGIQVNTAATEIAATSKEQQATASEIAATTVEIGATSRQISATAKELVETISEVTTVAEQTAQLAGSGQSGIGRMEATMHQIVSASGTIASKLAVLNEKAANINTVVTTINKVADQTNLLSLNAAIEAEKAGEYGLGFAVVATEIRRLADQTAVATYDIEQMVKEMQSAVSAGVMGMDKFSDEVRSGVEDVRQVGAQLAQIIQQVQALTPRFESVNDGMKSQAIGAQQISEALGQLSESAQQTAQSLQQSYQVIEKLNEASQGLQNGVSRFKMAA